MKSKNIRRDRGNLAPSRRFQSFIIMSSNYRERTISHAMKLDSHIKGVYSRLHLNHHQVYLLLIFIHYPLHTMAPHIYMCEAQGASWPSHVPLQLPYYSCNLSCSCPLSSTPSCNVTPRQGCIPTSRAPHMACPRDNRDKRCRLNPQCRL